MEQLQYILPFGVLALLVELPAVKDVVPYAVETTGDGAHGGEEGVAHPDGKHGVLLAQTLSGGNGAAVTTAYPAAEGKLDGAAEEAGQGDARQQRPADMAAHEATGGDGDG